MIYKILYKSIKEMRTVNLFKYIIKCKNVNDMATFLNDILLKSDADTYYFCPGKTILNSKFADKIINELMAIMFKSVENDDFCNLIYSVISMDLFIYKANFFNSAGVHVDIFEPKFEIIC